ALAAQDLRTVGPDPEVHPAAVGEIDLPVPVAGVTNLQVPETEQPPAAAAGAEPHFGGELRRCYRRSECVDPTAGGAVDADGGISTDRTVLQVETHRVS